jgi:hypothetical protein
MSLNRNAVIVACTIVKMIPESETQFLSELKEMIMDSAYSAPELLYSIESWRKLENIMHKYITVVDTPLKKKIVEEYIGGPLMASAA